MKKIPYFLFLSLLGFVACTNVSSTKEPPSSEEDLTTTTDKRVPQSVDQYKHLMEILPAGEFPRSYSSKEDKLITSGSDWWCSGFYPGTLLYLYEETGDEQLHKEAQRMLTLLEKEQYNTTTHDLGFMMYCSFGNANRLEPKEEYQEILLQSAKSLSTRFNETVGCIKSWDSGEDDFLVIIDNMMNLELLFWATKESGDSTFYDIAVEHANTTLENHFREDNSSYHVINYNPETGEVKEKRTAQGAADESAWARGQAWGLYGYTVMYRETKEQKYLDQAVKIADFYLNHPNLPEEKIPYWDFNAPEIPGALRDASAGAITASALLELQSYVDDEKQEKYLSDAQIMLETLLADEYFATDNKNGGFILKHGVGHIPENSEVDVPLTYGDYYLVEAMLRYKEL